MDIAIGHRIKFENPENLTKSIIYDIPGPGQVLALILMIFVVFFYILGSENVRGCTRMARPYSVCTCPYSRARVWTD